MLLKIKDTHPRARAGALLSILEEGSFNGGADVAPRNSEKEDHLNVKPIFGTLRATNPVRQSRASPPQAEK